MMLRILQGAVVLIFVSMAVMGAIVLFTMPERMGAYTQFLQAILPVFIAQVIPALIGSPLTDYIRAKATKPKEG